MNIEGCQCRDCIDDRAAAEVDEAMELELRDQFLARVQKGIALLEEKKPDWINIVDTGKLDMADGCYCILGQLFGAYGRGTEELEINFMEEDYGFYASYSKYYTLLDELWADEIYWRRGE